MDLPVVDRGDYGESISKRVTQHVEHCLFVGHGPWGAWVSPEIQHLGSGAIVRFRLWCVGCGALGSGLWALGFGFLVSGFGATT